MFEKVLDKQINEGNIVCVRIPSSNRSVMLIKYKGKVYCLDQACYR